MTHLSEKTSHIRLSVPTDAFSLTSLRALIRQVGLSVGLKLWAEKDTVTLGDKHRGGPVTCLAVYEAESGGEARYYVCPETSEEGVLTLTVHKGARRKRLGFGRRRRQEDRDKLIKQVIEDAIFWCIEG